MKQIKSQGNAAGKGMKFQDKFAQFLFVADLSFRTYSWFADVDADEAQKIAKLSSGNIAVLVDIVGIKGSSQISLRTQSA
jgi:hypothetical protein